MSQNTLNNFLRSVNTISNSIGSSPAENYNLNAPLSVSSDPVAYMSAIRQGSVPMTARAQSVSPTFTTASWGASADNAGNDWRVRIELPSLPEYDSSPILAPLKNSNNSMVFPLTPQIMINHSAQYNPLTPVHSNYPFQVYQNSQVEDITITCDFPVENEADGRYWVAAVHFLRSVTKMYYGTSNNNGAPPPLVHLNGYGDFIFNRIPCVVKMFSMDLREGVDYIQVPVTSTGGISSAQVGAAGGFTYVPTLSMITVQLGLAYSRDQIRQFNLETFVRGGYIGNKGFI